MDRADRRSSPWSSRRTTSPSTCRWRSIPRSEQTYPCVEVVVVNDGSTDGAAEILARLRRRGSSTVTQENRGLASARNTGILAARGEYIALLDGDDLWLPTRLERLVEVLEARPRARDRDERPVHDRRGRADRAPHVLAAAEAAVPHRRRTARSPRSPATTSCPSRRCSDAISSSATGCSPRACAAPRTTTSGSDCSSSGTPRRLRRRAARLLPHPGRQPEPYRRAGGCALGGARTTPAQSLEAGRAGQRTRRLRHRDPPGGRGRPPRRRCGSSCTP